MFLLTVIDRSFATGGPFCTVMLTVAVLLSIKPSFVLNVKESGPK